MWFCSDVVSSHFINFRYAKGQDVDNWLIIDERTADIRLNKIPDYESKFLVNNTYYAHIICITKGKSVCVHFMIRM